MRERREVEVVRRGGGREPDRFVEELDGVDVELDKNGVPIIRGVSDKAAILERRRHYLGRRIKNRETSRNARELDRLEIGALFAGQVALTYHRNAIQRLDEPIGLLQQIVEAYDGPADDEGRVRGLMAQARLLLEEWPGMVRR